MHSRTNPLRTSDLVNRAQSCRRRVFTLAEDKTIIKSVTSSKFHNNWESVAKLLPWRTPRQCRDRWTYYLSPNNNLSPFTPEEDQIIVQKVNEMGTKWTLIAKILKGRSDNSIKNRWYSKLKSLCFIDGNGKYSLNGNNFDSSFEDEVAAEKIEEVVKLANIDENSSAELLNAKPETMKTEMVINEKPCEKPCEMRILEDEIPEKLTSSNLKQIELIFPDEDEKNHIGQDVNVWDSIFFGWPSNIFDFSFESQIEFYN